MLITPIFICRHFCFSRRIIISEPPVDTPAKNTNPRPTPQIIPPYSAEIRGSTVGTGISANRSINTEERIMPRKDPQKNFLPIFIPARMNSGTLSRAVIVPTEPIFVKYTNTIARPDRPPAFMPPGIRNRSRPSANRAQPIVVFSRSAMNCNSFCFIFPPVTSQR